MKKWLCAILSAATILSLAAPGMAQDWKFERKIDIVCPWGVGGGADTTLRPMAMVLKDILGVEVEIINVTGGNGVNGLEYTYKQPADGYTFMLSTQSLIMQDLQGTTSMDFRTSFVPVARLVHSINILTGSKIAMEQKGYSNFSELMEYAEAHPFEVTAGMLTTTGVDGAGMREALKGLDVLEVTYPSGSEMSAALVGGHIDLVISGSDEIAGLIESGDIVPLCVLAEQRMKNYPDVECTGELGINSFMGPWRALLAKEGTPQAAIDTLVAAIEQAVQTPQWQEFLASAAYDERPGFAGPEELAQLIEEEYRFFTEYLRAEDVLVKDYYAQ